MHHREAVRQKDRGYIRKAIEKEMKDQLDHGNCTIMKKAKVPSSEFTLPTAWQMRRKRDIMTQRMLKLKARLNIDGPKMKRCVHFTETHAPVATCNSLRLVITVAVDLSWNTIQLDYVLACP